MYASRPRIDCSCIEGTRRWMNRSATAARRDEACRSTITLHRPLAQHVRLFIISSLRSLTHSRRCPFWCMSRLQTSRTASSSSALFYISRSNRRWIKPRTGTSPSDTCFSPVFRTFQTMYTTSLEHERCGGLYSNPRKNTGRYTIEGTIPSSLRFIDHPRQLPRHPPCGSIGNRSSVITYHPSLIPPSRPSHSAH